MKKRTKVTLIVLLALAVGMLGIMIFIDRQLKPTLDTNNDGKPDEWYQFDIYGRLVSISKDRNKDGTVDHIERFKKGKLKKIRVDMDKNGVFEVMAVFNDDEIMFQFYRDINQDGIYERLIHYDPATRLPVSWEQDTNGDGKFDTSGKRGEKWEIPEDQVPAELLSSHENP